MDEFVNGGQAILFEELDGHIEQSPASALVEHFDDGAHPKEW